MRRIVCPTDFSETALNANMYAAELANIIDAEMVLLHVMHVPAIDVNSAANVLDSLMDAQKNAAKAKLEAIAEEIAEEKGVKVHVAYDFGLAVDIIVETARSKGAFMIVMGTNGVNNVLDQLMGTVSYGVVKRSEIPTLVVPKIANFTGVSHIAFANDHKEKVAKEMEFLYHFNEHEMPRIDIISVEPGKEGGYYEEECVREEGGVKEVCIWSDKIGAGIERYIENNDISILAVKRHHRSFFENLFHHSTTEEMLNISTVPVLVFN